MAHWAEVERGFDLIFVAIDDPSILINILECEIFLFKRVNHAIAFEFLKVELHRPTNKG